MKRQCLDSNDLRCLFDIAVESMDFGSGFLDHEEVLVLRRVAVLIGVDEMTATPINFKASFAHDYTDPWMRKVYGGTFLDWHVLGDIEVCRICSRAEANPVHHGVSVTEPTSGYETA